jgi:tRNA guanosine-2'-O-methyltransferase
MYLIGSQEVFPKENLEVLQKLFSLGPLERRDAYNVLSLYLSFFPCTEEYEDVDTSGSVEAFDIRAEKEFWDEIRRGLVPELYCSTIFC